MRIEHGRLEMTTEEERALDFLMDQNGARAGISRRDPGNSGPLVVEFADRTYEVYSDGGVLRA